MRQSLCEGQIALRVTRLCLGDDSRLAGRQGFTHVTPGSIICGIRLCGIRALQSRWDEKQEPYIEDAWCNRQARQTERDKTEDNMYDTWVCDRVNIKGEKTT